MAEGKAETESGVEPFRWWIKRNAINPIDMGDIPPFDWHGWEARYDNDMERLKNTSRNFNEMPYSIRSVFGKLRCDNSVVEWRERLGYSVIDDPKAHGGGLHCSVSGSWLQIHLDYNVHPFFPDKRRALNLIAFLNPEWKREWGGALLLCDPMGNAVKKIYPEPGMLAAFETSSRSYHGVMQTSKDAPPRVSAAVYYLSSDDGTDIRKRAIFFPNRNSPNCPQEVALCM